MISIQELKDNRRYNETKILTKTLYTLTTSSTILTHVLYSPISHIRVSILKYRTCDITPPYITCTNVLKAITKIHLAMSFLLPFITILTAYSKYTQTQTSYQGKLPYLTSIHFQLRRDNGREIYEEEPMVET